ncbi:hypothetical protein GF357_01105 [Candidatus Dojkabacteria bacterium]|nr:hypothetical protein [Candidatus Dojkabacteria bacterium]
MRNSAEESIKVLTQLSELREDYTKQLGKLGKRQKLGERLLEYMLSEPIVSVPDAKVILGVTYPTANALIGELKKLGVLTQATEGKVDRLFCLQSYVDIFRS